MDLGQQEDASAAMAVGVFVDDSKKSCSICGIDKTPLWRSGPDGPKSLCNACGIKHRKRKMLMCKAEKKKPSQSTGNPAGSSLPSTPTEAPLKSKPKLEKSSSTNLRQSVKVGLAAFGKDMVLLQRRRSIKRQTSEEEEAAALLMSLSYGSVYA